MSRLKIGNIVAIISILMNCSGCVTLKEMPALEGQSKISIQQGWEREPDKIYYNSDKLKYGADELWIYVYPGGDEARYYFKDDILIKREEVSYATL